MQTQAIDYPNLQLPAGIGELRTLILRKALLDHICKETVANRQKLNADGRGVDRFQNPTVTATWGPCPEWAWCSAMVCTHHKDALGRYPFGKMIRSVDKHQDAAIAVGQYRRTHPVPADFFVILHERDRDHTISRGHTGHVCWSRPMTATAGEFLSIEGNFKNGWAMVRRSYDFALPPTPGLVDGFGSPFPLSEDPVGFELGRGPIEGARPLGTTR